MNQAKAPTAPGAQETRKMFAAKLRRAMLEKGWHQSELARQSGLARDQISKYNRAEALPSDASLAKIAGALGVAPGTLLPSAEATNRGAGAVATTRLEVVPGGKGIVWLHIDRRVCTSTALAVIELLEKDTAENAA